jgi:hypothetical protein
MVTTIFCDNYFPPTVIEVIKWKSGKYENRTDYIVPNDGKYGKEVIGLWKVKYKKLDPDYYCEGQRNIGGCH